jgi:hypothetical protein
MNCNTSALPYPYLEKAKKFIRYLLLQQAINFTDDRAVGHYFFDIILSTIVNID